MEKIGIASFTARGRMLAEKIARGLKESGCGILWYETGLRGWCARCFAEADALIFVGACGIAVRSVAPFLKGKTEDPAVVVLDEAGNFVISLLSGHLGGANELALRIAGLTGACPVITTASDVRGKIAVDVFAKKNDLAIPDMKMAKKVEAAILREEPVSVCCSGLVDGAAPEELRLLRYEEREWSTQDEYCGGSDDASGQYRRHGSETAQCLEAASGMVPCVGTFIWISEHRLSERECRHYLGCSRMSADVLHLIPRAVAVGIGCRRGKEADVIGQAVMAVLDQSGIPLQAVCGVASIDLKKDEEGILRVCERLGVSFRTFSAEELLSVRGTFSSSEFVRSVTGVDNVCERSALALAGAGGRLIRKKYANNGVTVALAVREWRVRFEK